MRRICSSRITLHIRYNSRVTYSFSVLFNSKISSIKTTNDNICQNIRSIGQIISPDAQKRTTLRLQLMLSVTPGPALMQKVNHHTLQLCNTVFLPLYKDYFILTALMELLCGYKLKKKGDVPKQHFYSAHTVWGLSSGYAQVLLITLNDESLSKFSK